MQQPYYYYYYFSILLPYIQDTLHYLHPVRTTVFTSLHLDKS